MKAFKAAKVRLKKKYSIAIGEAEEGQYPLLPEFDSVNETQTLVHCLNYAIRDFLAKRLWESGIPVTRGIYLVEMDDEFTVIRVDKDGIIERIDSKPVGIINRFFPLKIKEEGV